MNARHYHTWQKGGSAPDFNGVACCLWRCSSCGKEWEVFADVDLSKR